MIKGLRRSPRPKNNPGHMRQVNMINIDSLSNCPNTNDLLKRVLKAHKHMPSRDSQPDSLTCLLHKPLKLPFQHDLVPGIPISFFELLAVGEFELGGLRYSLREAGDLKDLRDLLRLLHFVLSYMHVYVVLAFD